MLHAVQDVLVGLHDLLLQELEVSHALLELVPVRTALSVIETAELGQVRVLGRQNSLVLVLQQFIPEVCQLGSSPTRPVPGVVGPQLLHSVSVAERVEGVLAGRHARADHGDHASPRLVSDEGISEHLRQFAGSEGKVSSLPAQCPDALLQCQERLVDLGPLHPRLPVGRVGVGAPLVTGQVDQRELAEQRFLVVVDPQDDLKHRVTSRGVRVSAGLSGCSEVVAVSDELQHVLHAVHHGLGEADHHHLLLPVLQHSELRLPG